VEPDDSFSWLARNLFYRLTTIKAHQRYTAKDACRHPWITRNQKDIIPKSFIDELRCDEQTSTLK
jgi:hypothetical protein